MFEVVKNGSTRGHRRTTGSSAAKHNLADRFKFEVRRLPVDWSYIVLLVLLSIWLLLLASCSATGHQLRRQRPAGLEQIGYPQSVAVLPFANLTDQPGIEDFVRATFYSHMSPYPYRDIELQSIDRTLRGSGLDDPAKVRRIPVKKLGRLLGCDAVVFGEVTEYQRLYAGIYSQMAVGASVEMWDTRTGRKIWSDEQVTRKHEGGIPLSLTDIPLIGLRSGMNLTESAKVQTVDDLSRQLTGRIPVPDPSGAFKSHDGSKWRSLKRLTMKTHSSRYRSLKRLTKKADSEDASISLANSAPRPNSF